MDVIISFSDIYKKSIGLFDDPKITVVYETNVIQFNKLMYTFLQNSISLFNNPISVVKRLSIYSEPKGTMEVFIGDGETKVFHLSDDFEIIEGSMYQYIANGDYVNGILDTENKTVTFPHVIEDGQECSIEQYFAGGFSFNTQGMTDNIAGISQSVVNQIKDILARLLVKSWGENTRNFLLDIQNILNDTDFKLHPASNALRAKNVWIAQLDQEILQYQNKLAWNIRMFNKNSNV